MGIAKIDLRQTIAMEMLDKKIGFHPMRIINLLSNLPENTRVISLEDKGIHGLSHLFELSVENDIFEDGAKIIAHYDNEICPDKDGTTIRQITNPRGLDIKPAMKKL